MKLIKNILVVDDNIDFQQRLVSFLKSKGFDVYTADNAEIAYEISLDLKIDLIISEICLPKSGAFELIKKTTPYNPEIEFIVMTGKSDFLNDWDIESFKNVDNIICGLKRPFNFDDLMTIIDGKFNSAYSNV